MGKKSTGNGRKGAKNAAPKGSEEKGKARAVTDAVEKAATEVTVKRNYKDSVFRALFRDKKALLSLYNAVNGSAYTNTEDLEIYTLENAIYMNMKNDVSFLFDCSLTLYEHQSTYNPNLPLRDLFYMADLLKRYTVGMNLYSSAKVRIPTHRFVVFYNGTDWKEEKKVLCLSDLFLQPTDNPDLELRVMMCNINIELFTAANDIMIFVSSLLVSRNHDVICWVNRIHPPHRHRQKLRSSDRCALRRWSVACLCGAVNHSRATSG